MGILPPASTKIKQELNIENTLFGFLGSVVYLGQLIGSGLATGILQNCNYKAILSTCLFCNIGTLILFTLTDWYMVLVLCRMFTGLFQVFFCIYFPVWADVFGNETQKAQWLTYLLIASPLGVIMGYGLSASFLDNIGWRWAFYVQSIMMIPSFLGILWTPYEYFDVVGTTQKIDKMNKEHSKLKISKEGSVEMQRLALHQDKGEDDVSPMALKVEGHSDSDTEIEDTMNQ